VLTLLRPHGWGKSVFLKMLTHYYDCAYRDAPIVNIPGGNTPSACQYMTMTIDLSRVAHKVGRLVVGTPREPGVSMAIGAALDEEMLGVIDDVCDRYKLSGMVDRTVSTGYPVELVVSQQQKALRYA
jgi:hypothetical protein